MRHARTHTHFLKVTDRIVNQLIARTVIRDDPIASGSLVLSRNERSASTAGFLLAGSVTAA